VHRRYIILVSCPLMIYFLSFADQPSERYWELLAERRRVALADALKENREVFSLCVVLYYHLHSFTRKSRS